MNTQPIYDVDYFLRKFEAIPEELCCVNAITIDLPDGNTAHCAVGWCARRNGFTDGAELIELFTKHFGPSCLCVVDINNGKDFRYPQPTPKQRILAALRDIKAKQQSTPQHPKTVYKFVWADQKVKEMTEKELSQQ